MVTTTGERDTSMLMHFSCECFDMPLKSLDQRVLPRNPRPADICLTSSRGAVSAFTLRGENCLHQSRLWLWTMSSDFFLHNKWKKKEEEKNRVMSLSIFMQNHSGGYSKAYGSCFPDLLARLEPTKNYVVSSLSSFVCRISVAWKMILPRKFARVCSRTTKL